MTPLFKKLNLKDQATITVVNAPDSFEPELEAIQEIQAISVQSKPSRWSSVEFAIFFVQTLSQVKAAAKQIAKTKDDPVIWLAYPKGTSKNYTCEFNRDTGWQAIGDVGFEGVRQVAIDADWSALRFRRVDHIKTMKRRNSMAISKKGKARTKKS